MTLTNARVGISYSGAAATQGDLHGLNAQFTPAAFSVAFTNGDGVNQVKQIFADTRTLAASTSEDLDIVGGGLLDIEGAAFAPDKIKAIIIKNYSTSNGNIVVGGAAATQFASFFSDAADEIIIKPGGIFCLVAPDAAGYACAAGASDLLKIDHVGAGGNATYDIILYGSAA